MTKEELMKLEKEEIIVLLLTIIEQQAQEISELKRRLNQNSKNSSKPPSSDGYNKPAPKSLRQSSGKPVGGQKGHDGSGMKLIGEVNETFNHRPVECEKCPHQTECTSSREINETRYEIDIQINPLTTAHQTVRVCCPQTGKVLTGSFPAHVSGTLQYGVNVSALAVALNTVGMVSINRTHEILSGVFGLSISTGTISSMISDCAEQVRPAVDLIREAIKSEPLIHTDETGVTVDKKTAWAHVACTDKLTHIEVQENRGQKGMDAIGILMIFVGTVIHDCFSPYFKYAVRHGLCVAHLLRELISVTENTGQAWAQSMIDLLLQMKKTKERVIAQGKNNASPYFLRKFSRLFDVITADALLHNPIPIREPGKRGKVKRGKAGALIDRLILHKDKYILWFTDFSVPFDNNQAERDIRMFKVKLKVSGCFRSLTGANDFALIASYVGTARKNGVNAFNAIKDALTFKPFIPYRVSTTD
jgi:transposase